MKNAQEGSRIRKAVWAGIVLLVLGFCWSPLLRSQQPAPNAKTRFKIDVHYHYQDTDEWAKETVRIYRQYNTIAVIAFPYQSLEKAKKLVAEYPDVFVAFGAIDLDDPQALAKIDALHAANFKGVGETASEQASPDDERYAPIYRKLQEYGMALLLHTGLGSAPQVPGLDAPALKNGIGIEARRPHFLDTVARDFPQLTLIGAHFGFPEYDVAAEVSRWNSNLFWDLSDVALVQKDRNPKFWSEVLWWRPGPRVSTTGNYDHAFERLVFGSDAGPAELPAIVDRYNRMLTVNGIPETVQTRIWSGTLSKALGIAPPRDRKEAVR